MMIAECGLFLKGRSKKEEWRRRQKGEVKIKKEELRKAFFGAF
jgi:hypothetical protein